MKYHSLKIISVALLLGLLAMSGCVKDLSTPEITSEQGEDAMIKLSLNVSGNMTASRATSGATSDAMTGANTRGMSEAQENAVNSVNILVFDNADKLDYMRRGSISTAAGKVIVEALFKISKGAADKYRVVVLVNSQWKLNSLFGGDYIDAHRGKSYAEIMAMLEEVAPATYSQWLEEGLPMWGEYEEPVQITPGMSLPAMPIIKSVARVDVGVNPSPTYTNGMANWGELSNFSLEEVIIYKAGKKYMIAPLRSDFDYQTNQVTETNLPLSQQLRSPHQKYTIENSGRTGGTAAGKGVHISGQIYLPETDVNLDDGAPGEAGAYLDTDHLNRIAIVVGGKYNGASAMSYYRIDFVKSADRTKLHDLRRNHSYQAVIKTVLGSGFDDPDDAYQSYVSQIEATINDWEGTTVGVVMDGENVLTLSRDRVYTGREGSGPDPVECVVKTTNIEDELTITGPYDPKTDMLADQLWIASPSISAVTQIVEDGVSMKTATITLGGITALEEGQTLRNPRDTYFLVKSGNMEYEYHVVQERSPWLAFAPFANGNCFPMDGGLHTLTVGSPIAWNVEITSGNENDVVTDLHTRSGGFNPMGDNVWFSTVNDIDKGLETESHVTFTFTDPLGVCPPKNLTVPVVTGFTVAPADVANCFMLNPASGVRTGMYIPVTRANEAIPGSIGTNAELSAEFLWTDNITGTFHYTAGNFLDNSEPVAADNASVQYYTSSGRGTTGYLFVQQGRGERVSDGNTVIALKTAADNTIRWSWHIWTTEYRPTGLWMDRHLGAMANSPLVGGVFNEGQWEKTFGLYYQWGRKEPFTGFRLYCIFAGQINATYFHSGELALPREQIEDPMAFRTLQIADAMSWDSATGTKTVFDPCPAGYRVSTADLITHAEWSVIIDRGRTNPGAGGYYPYSGYMGGSGVIEILGSAGYGWFRNMQPVAEVHGGNLTMGTEVQHNTAMQRINIGMPVRCVQE